jgi:hypothetical protein
MPLRLELTCKARTLVRSQRIQSWCTKSLSQSHSPLYSHGARCHPKNWFLVHFFDKRSGARSQKYNPCSQAETKVNEWWWSVLRACPWVVRRASSQQAANRSYAEEKKLRWKSWIFRTINHERRLSGQPASLLMHFFIPVANLLASALALDAPVRGAGYWGTSPASFLPWVHLTVILALQHSSGPASLVKPWRSFPSPGRGFLFLLRIDIWVFLLISPGMKLLFCLRCFCLAGILLDVVLYTNGQILIYRERGS